MQTRLICLSLVLASSSFGGCAALAPKAVPKLAAEIAPGSASAEKPQGYIVEFRDATGRKVQATEKQLGREMHVQEALKEARAFSKWNRVQLELIRQLPAGGEHRMKMEYSLGSKRVEPENDYQLHAGDRIVVTEDPSTIVDDILKKMSPGGKSPLQGPKSSKYVVRH